MPSVTSTSTRIDNANNITYVLKKYNNNTYKLFVYNKNMSTGCYYLAGTKTGKC
jgi:hypothetical protein